jgi:hypothetical protein
MTVFMEKISDDHFLKFLSAINDVEGNPHLPCGNLRLGGSRVIGHQKDGTFHLMSRFHQYPRGGHTVQPSAKSQ